MRTSDWLAGAVVASGLLFGGGGALAFDGSNSPSSSAAALAPVPLTRNPLEAFEKARSAYAAGDMKAAASAFQVAAGQGHVGAQWMLGRMYADGKGVDRSDVKAFEYFSEFVRSNAGSDPDSPQAMALAPYMANALVWLGSVYVEGIPGSDVRPNPVLAVKLLTDAAVNYSDPNAQYNLAQIFLNGTAGKKDPVQAIRWLNLAVQKDHAPSRALLGHLLFQGEVVPRQAALGLMWMTLARERAETSGDKRDRWIIDLHEEALKRATGDERALALTYLERWMDQR